MGMKSLPIPVAQARSNFSDVLDDARKGRRIRLTRHGKPVGWIIGEEERQRLEAAPLSKKPKSRRR
jgi:prevent-host-death family protein